MSDPAVLAPQLLTDSQQLIVCYEAEDKSAYLISSAIQPCPSLLLDSMTYFLCVA